GSTDQSARKNSRLNASVLIELTQMRHRLLDDASPDAHAAYQAPIAMNLSVLLANRVAQVHAPSEPRPQPKKIPKVVTTRSNHPRAPSNPLILLASPPAKPQKPPPNCASWARIGRLILDALRNAGEQMPVHQASYPPCFFIDC